jgi:hypothetical protein
MISVYGCRIYNKRQINNQIFNTVLENEKMNDRDRERERGVSVVSWKQSQGSKGIEELSGKWLHIAVKTRLILWFYASHFILLPAAQNYTHIKNN